MQITKVDTTYAINQRPDAIPATQCAESSPMQEAFASYPSTSASDFRIVESQLPLLGGMAGHNMLVLLDDQGQFRREIQGLATSREGKIKPIGYLPSDRLKFHSFDRPYLYQAGQAHACLIKGSRADLENRMDAAIAAGSTINQRDLPYPFLGLGKNSNSVASTLVRVMGLKEPASLPGGAWVMPGQGSMVLDSDTIASIQDEFHIDPGAKAVPLDQASAAV